MSLLKKVVTIVIIFLLSESLISQTREDTKTHEVQKKINTETLDYKITASNNSYMEIEFFPNYKEGSFNFQNALFHSDKFGKPDVGFRLFPVILPVAQNNRIEVLDYKYDESFNVDVKPIPTPKRANNKYEILYDFLKDDKVYRDNSYFPKDVVSVNYDGMVRHYYFGSVRINPVLYNPVARTVRKYSYIKFRVTFGGNPIIINKTLSIHEKDLLWNIAVNSDAAKNWSTIEFNSIKENPPVQNSVLASGDFYKIEVKESGMYKIDKNLLLNAGINVNSIDPKTIKIYGNGGKELPYGNNIPVTTDLIENRIYVEGEDDHSFDDNDYILFYGRSPNDWEYDTANAKYYHYINHYSISNFYWITYGGGNGLRMLATNSPNIPNLTPAEYFIDRFFEEPEVNNLGSTGTLWLSQRIGTGESYVFNKELRGYVDGTDINLKFRFGNASSETATFLIQDYNSNFSNLINVSGVPNPLSHVKIYTLETTYELLPGWQNIDLSLSLPAQYNSMNISGFYDYYEIHYRRRCNSAFENQLRFNSADTNGIVEYQVSSFNTQCIKLFDVTEFQNVSLIIPVSYNGGVLKFQDNNTIGNPKEYYVIGGDNYKVPVSVSQKIPNQNLHGITDGASFIIISPKEFFSAANRLKTQREIPGPNYLKTLVVDIEQIYNEFSGGLLDPVAQRNFLKHAFNNWNDRPVYVMFMGDGSYDYKNIYNLNVKNFCPPIEKTTDDISELLSYPSDDFITEINESYPSPSPCRPDFSNGRTCVNSEYEANNVVDKIIGYESPQNKGFWKKKVLYVADDGWTTENNQGQEGSIHTDQSEDIAKHNTPKDFEKEKVYIVTYPAVFTPEGRRKPAANIDIIKEWNEGKLVVNYVGHGSFEQWAHERIFHKDESIPQLNNKDKYPLVTASSCNLIRWDDPFNVSMVEELFWVKDKGAIGIFGSVRAGYSSSNHAFNRKFWQNYMGVKDTLNLPVRIGNAMYNVKNQLSSITDNDTKFCLIADPTLRISIPQHITRVDSINSIPGIDTAHLKALQKVRISGSILRPNSSFWSDYNGDIIVKVFDVEKYITLIDFGHTFNFKRDGRIIFTTNKGVENGKWSVDFIVPRDISSDTGTGKLIAYFYNNNTEGSGFTTRFTLNGIDTTAAIDTTGPEITIYMGDRNFRTGDITNQNSKILADFFDVSGINMTGTTGHEIEAILDNDEINKINLTPFYSSTTGYQYGSLEYPIEGIADGEHNLKVKAWDTYNNFNISSIDFVMMNSNQLRVENVYNYPNPMKDRTSFLFQHNIDEPLTASINIYTVSGRLIKKLNKPGITEKFVKIDWDGKDSDGDHIANGTYIYKVIVKSVNGGFSVYKTGKLAKLE